MKMLPHVGGARMEVMPGGSVMPACRRFCGQCKFDSSKKFGLSFQLNEL